MGADFLLWTLPKCQLTPPRQQAMLDAVQNLSDEELQEMYERGVLSCDGDPCIPEGVGELRRAAEAAYKDCVTEYEALEGGREVTEVRFSGRFFYATGGMSWGDEPTSATGLFQRLDLPRLWDLLHGWALEDAIAGDPTIASTLCQELIAALATACAQHVPPKSG